VDSRNGKVGSLALLVSLLLVVSAVPAD